MRYAAGSKIGAYRIDGMLGRGGMATVYLATDETLGRAAALKVLDPGLGAQERFVRRFEREGRMQAALEHPNVVAVYETLETDDGLVIAMQLVQGPTVAALIATGALTGERAIGLLEQIASAIDAAHTAGLVHRDIKARNVLVADGDHAYLADFGLTTLGDDSGVTATGELLGTVAYLAPEVVRGEPATAAADRYSFAALAFEALTGSVVFPRATQAAVLYAHTTEPAPRASTRRTELPGALDPVFERALSKAPAERPETATELVAAIRAAIGDELLATLPPPVPMRELEAGTAGSTAAALEPLVAPAPRAAGRTRALTLAGLLAAAVAGAAIALVAGGPDDAPARAAPVPPPLEGATVLGSDLTGEGRTRDCRGGAVRPDSPACTVLQARLPGRAVVVPDRGVVRRWAVRAAQGELQLQVLRQRDGYFQVAVSQNEFVSDGQVHAFDADLAVEAGDVLSLHVVSGSGVGIRAREGAQTTHWIPRLRGVSTPPAPRDPGLDGELLLRVEYLPGAQQALPKQVTGPRAASLSPGKVVMRRRAQPPGLRAFDLRLVEVGRRYVLDSFHRGRRLARLNLPDFVPGLGEVTMFDTYVNPGDPNAEVNLEYRRTGSIRVVSHYILALPRAFDYIN